MDMSIEAKGERREGFAPGDWVREVDSGVRGEIIGPGRHPDEWLLRLPAGVELGCLGTNLVKCAPPWKNASPVQRRRQPLDTWIPDPTPKAGDV
jgi:hypothetical protein